MLTGAAHKRDEDRNFLLSPSDDAHYFSFADILDLLGITTPKELGLESRLWLNY